MPAHAEQPGLAPPASPPVTVAGYVRPPAKEAPGLIRANHDDDEGSEAPGRPPVEPLFSTEGILSKKETDRRRRRVPLLGWVAGVGGLAILAILAGSALITPPPSAPAADGLPSASPIAAAGSASESILGASIEPSSTASGSADAGGSPSAGSTSGRLPGSTASPGPSSAPSSSPGPSGSATDSPSPSASATPTDTPTPTPVVTPTPTPLLPVSFGPGTYTVPKNHHLILSIDTLPGATCNLSVVPYHPPLYDLVAPPSGLLNVEWGDDPTPPGPPWWNADDYTITATCTRSGYDPGSAQKDVHITG